MSIDEIIDQRIKAIAAETARLNEALAAVCKEKGANKCYLNPSRKMAKAKRASLDLSAALTEFRKSLYR